MVGIWKLPYWGSLLEMCKSEQGTYVSVGRWWWWSWFGTIRLWTERREMSLLWRQSIGRHYTESKKCRRKNERNTFDRIREIQLAALEKYSWKNQINTVERMREIQLTKWEKYSRKNERNTEGETHKLCGGRKAFADTRHALAQGGLQPRPRRRRGSKPVLSQHLSLPAIALLRARVLRAVK